MFKMKNRHKRRYYLGK